MRSLIHGIAATLAFSASFEAKANSGPVCFPIDQVYSSMKAHDYVLTFEGFVSGGSVLLFTEKDGQWIMVLEMGDGRGCAFAAGDEFNLTIGSLM